MNYLQAVSHLSIIKASIWGSYSMINRENPVESSSPAPSGRNRRALLIGIEADIERRLRGVSERSIAAWRDVQALQTLLKSSFSTIAPLINLDRQRLEEEIYAAASNCQPNDLLLIYYSGQGMVDEDGHLFLAATNTRNNTLGELNKATAIAFSSLQSLLSDCPAQQVIILDCSFLGSSSHRIDIAAQLGAPNRIVLSATSTTGYTTAHKQGELSVYTEFLREAIETGCGLPPGTAVTTHQIHQYIQSRMQPAFPAVEPQIIPPHPEVAVAIATAPPRNDALMYRSEVEERAKSGTISDFDRLLLNWHRNQLGLSPDTANQIEASVLKPHQTHLQNRQRYQDTLKAIAQFQYPFKPATEMALDQLRQQLGLSPDQAAAIAKETLAAPEQRYRQNLQQYEQYVAQQVASGAWLDRAQRNEFRYLEEQLHLLPRHVNVIWQRHAPAPSAVPPESDDPQLPPYAARLQQYQQFFLDHAAPNRPLPPQTLQELDSLQQSLHLRSIDVALAEETAVRQQRDRDEAQLQRYQQELLMADDSPSSQAHLKQMQRGVNEKDAAIAELIAALLNPQKTPTVTETIAPPIDQPTQVADSTAIESETPLEAPIVTVPPETLIDESSQPDHPLPVDDDRTEPPRHLREIPPGQTLPPSRRRASIADRLSDRSLPLRLLKAILFAIVAVVVGRFVIAQILRILPYPIDNIIGITLFGLIIIFAWKQIDQLR
ncbi:caspase family protein [Microcoleus sp. FACHB-1515]|uniref:caspase family protein n=1 Tax=Cyanophyceae TaxID=3028117 RepID=UPI001683F058|nr:caspase family protein [Microcoleus sp. FACHB-1515]MBD2091900.1 caspase family protein [Microcoleus sp. FACHB-1515]